jgi:hypothetical protein
VGVLVNDFGSIKIDAELVVGVDGNMISLANGCVCCQIRDDLVESVGALLTRSEAVEYVLLEASGVADPAGIFATFNDSSVRDRIRLDRVTCVADADQVFAHPEYPPLMDLRLREVGFADMLILNKVDLAGPEPNAAASSSSSPSVRAARGAPHCSSARGFRRPRLPAPRADAAGYRPRRATRVRSSSWASPANASTAPTRAGRTSRAGSSRRVRNASASRSSPNSSPRLRPASVTPSE